MRGCKTLVFGLLAILMLPGIGRAIPELINYQGRLTDDSGTPITTTTTVEFRIWDAPAGGTELWTESQSVTPNAQGLFSVLLGSINPIPDSAWISAEVYLGIKVGADQEITPRTRMVSVSYAYRVATIDGSSGGTITSKVSIGPGHTNTGTSAFVAGENNTAGGNYSTVAGGYSNTASLNASTVGGGVYNSASGGWSTVGGGSSDTASGERSTVGGGSLNTASADHSTVGGGNYNIASGDYSTVGGGWSNTVSGRSATVPGGEHNAASGWYSAVGGGRYNTANSGGCTVGGGQYNTASFMDATVGGGNHNRAGGLGSTVGGGSSDTASGDNSTVGGGGHNVASGDGSTVGGGLSNTASAGISTVGGGGSNSASGPSATVPGGLYNIADGYSSFAAGFRAKALHDGTFVWADSTDADFASTAGNQFLIRAGGGVGINTDSPSEALSVSGNICYTGTIGACSDARYKTDVETLPNALNKVIRMRGVNYHWRTDEYPDQKFSGDRQVGFVAQELKEILPEVVIEDQNGYLSIDYGRLTPILVEAIKEMKAEKDAEIDALQKQVDELKELVTKLASQSVSTGSAYGMK